jgi:NADH dehydrogenase [ubiquinone] 1 alpha subcomplex assembly factor 7
LFQFGPAVYWHSSLREVPRVFSLFVLHEFLDALPVHKFQKTASGWREVLIDIQANSQVGKELAWPSMFLPT